MLRQQLPLVPDVASVNLGATRNYYLRRVVSSQSGLRRRQLADYIFLALAGMFGDSLVSMDCVSNETFKPSMEEWLGMYAWSWRVKNSRFRLCGRSSRVGGALTSRSVGPSSQYLSADKTYGHTLRQA